MNTEELSELLELKHEDRTAWVLTGMDDIESVGSHSWGVSFLCLTLGTKEDVDVCRCLKLAIFHDIAEVGTGDIVVNEKRPLEDSRGMTGEKKKKVEEEEMGRIIDVLGESEFEELWNEYKNKETAEAKFVKDMDSLDLAFEVLFHYRNDGFSEAPETMRTMKWP